MIFFVQFLSKSFYILDHQVLPGELIMVWKMVYYLIIRKPEMRRRESNLQFFINYLSGFVFNLSMVGTKLLARIY